MCARSFSSSTKRYLFGQKYICLSCNKSVCFWDTGFLVGNIATQCFPTSPLTKWPEHTDHYLIQRKQMSVLIRNFYSKEKLEKMDNSLAGCQSSSKKIIIVDWQALMLSYFKMLSTTGHPWKRTKKVHLVCWVCLGPCTCCDHDRDSFKSLRIGGWNYRRLKEAVYVLFVQLFL